MPADMMSVVVVGALRAVSRYMGRAVAANVEYSNSWIMDQTSNRDGSLALLAVRTLYVVVYVYCTGGGRALFLLPQSSCRNIRRIEP